MVVADGKVFQMSLRIPTVRALAGVAAALCLTSQVVAQVFWMTEPSLRASFAGATINGEYVDGRTFTESYDLSGSLAYTEHPTKNDLGGHWSIVRDRFCTIYDNSGTGGCFRVHRASFNCFEFYFETRTEVEARQSTPRKPSWTARAWRIDQPSTCRERPMV
jgi:hypothetical protein